MKNINFTANIYRLYDKVFRAKLRDNPEDTLKLLNIKKDDGVEFKVVTNTKDALFFIIPNIENFDIDYLNSIQAAVNTVGSVTTLGSAGTMSTFSSFDTTVSSLGCASTAGSIGTAGTLDV